MGKKHHACRACQHEKKTEIDRALLSGEAARQVASRYGLSATGLQRHQKHIAPSLLKAREAVEVGQASNVLSFVRGLVDKAHQFTNLAEQKGDLRTAMTGLRELTRMAELLAMLIYLVRRGFANGRIDGRKRRLVPEYWLSPELTQAILYLILCRDRRQALLPNCNKGCRDQICEQK